MRRISLTALALMLGATCAHAAAAHAGADLSFSTFYSASWMGWVNGWVIGGLLVIGAAIAIWLTGGAAVFATAIGTWIGNAAGLSGIAATNYGLALLGGGTLAAGGYGVAGGTILLTSVFSFTTQAAIRFAGDQVAQVYDSRAFQARLESLPRFPIPSSAPQSVLQEAVSRIQKDYYPKEDHRSPANKKAIENALFFLSDHPGLKNVDVDGEAQIETLRSLLYYHNSEYHQAHMSAARAIVLATNAMPPAELGKPQRKVSSFSVTELRALVSTALTRALGPEKDRNRFAISLPCAIFGISSFTERGVDVELSTKSLEASLSSEPDNPHAPLVIAFFTDMLRERHDIFRVRNLERVHSLLTNYISKPDKQAHARFIFAFKTSEIMKIKTDLITELISGAQGKKQKREIRKVMIETLLEDHLSIINLLEGVLVRLELDPSIGKSSEIIGRVKQMQSALNSNKNYHEELKNLSKKI